MQDSPRPSFLYPLSSTPSPLPPLFHPPFPPQKLTKFEASIGVEFRHIRLLARAFTGRSSGTNHLTLGSNQRLEFLGDTVLQLVASEFLYKHFPDHHEGHLSVSTSSAGIVGTCSAGTVGTCSAGTVGTCSAGTVGTCSAGTVGTCSAGTVGICSAGTVGTCFAGTVGTCSAGTVGTWSTLCECIVYSPCTPLHPPFINYYVSSASIAASLLPLPSTIRRIVLSLTYVRNTNTNSGFS